MLKLLPTKKAGASVSSTDSEKDPFGRSIEIGIVCTILFHVLVFWLAPHLTMSRITGSGTGFGIKPKQRDFNFQLAPGDVPKPPAPKKDPFKFVETNPDAPANTPDKTENFSSRDQQTAQPDPDKDSKGKKPRVDGQEEIKNDTDIVSGHRSPAQLAEAAPTPADTNKQADTTQAEQKARAEQVPLNGEEKFEGKSEDGVASAMSHRKEASNNAPQYQEGAKDSKSPEGGLVNIAATSGKPQPKPRVRLRDVQAPTTILQRNVIGSAQVGVQAIDAFKSEYGEYLAELREIIETQWHSIVNESATYPPSGTHVFVTFRLNSKGETEIVNVEETSGKPGAYSCLSAIQSRQPYRAWTEQMIALLGTSQEMRFDFYYY